MSVIRHEQRVARSLGQARTLRIAFAADWHAGPTTSIRTMTDAVERIEDVKPDVVLLGGDFVSLHSDFGRGLVPLLRRLEAHAGVYAVLGNHDHWAGARTIIDQLAHAGVVTLENRAVTLPHPFGRVSVVGIDDHLSGEPDAPRAFAGAADVRILVMHQPSGLLDLNGDRFDLAFAGHTHGGQIRLPWGPPIITPKGRLSRRYPAGRFETEHGPLLVSRGIGCTLLPLRWNAPADVLIVDLEGAEPPRDR